MCRESSVNPNKWSLEKAIQPIRVSVYDGPTPCKPDHDALRLLPRDTDAYGSQAPLAAAPPSSAHLGVFSALAPTSSTAAHTSGVRLGGHPPREASRVDIQLGVVLPWCSVCSSCSGVGIRSEMRAAVHLSGLHVFFERLPAVLHHPREPTCRVCNPVVFPPRSACAAGPLGLGCTFSRPAPYAPLVAVRHRSLSSAAERSSLENGYVPRGPSGLVPMHSTRAESPVFFWLPCTLHPPLLRDEHSDLRIRPPIHALDSILTPPTTIPPLFPLPPLVAHLLHVCFRN
ncbi:hypothetical protein B0H13DRAFT_2335565 [Mycena leptocephala]|nr:hypothetical protein B0H13DRAFT_2335565 [Mycena leptocephala]